MKRKAVSILLYIISGLLLVLGVLMVIRQYVLVPGEYVDPENDVRPSPTATATPVNTATPAPGETPAGTAAETPGISVDVTPYVKPIPVRIYFTDAEVMCDIVCVGRIEEGEKAGQMDTVDDPDLAAWYEPGPAPGEEGNALINGHKSWKGKIGRFSVLWNMELGDGVAIAFEDGSIRYFSVTSVDFYPYDDVPDEVMSFNTETPRVTLITCYGDFDRVVGTSKQRCVVVCEPVAQDDQRTQVAE